MSDEASIDALRTLVIEWAWCVDHEPPERSAALFTEDGVFEMPEGRWEGRPRILEVARARESKQRTSRHVVTNVRISADGDEAKGQGTVTVYRHDGPGTGDTLPSSVFDFADRYRRVDGTWAIEERVMSRIFARPPKAP